MIETRTLKIKYHDAKYGTVKRLEQNDKGNWIDVYSAMDMFIPSIFETMENVKEVEKELNSIMRAMIELEEIFTNYTGNNTDFYEIGQAKYKEKFEYFTKQSEEIIKPYLIPLGFSLQLPKNGEAFLAPRSSTFKSFGLIQVNSPGVIDESYCGDNDEWKMPVISIYQSIEITKGDKIGQFKIQEKMPKFDLVEVYNLGNEDRGGFGSTGTK